MSALGQSWIKLGAYRNYHKNSQNINPMLSPKFGLLTTLLTIIIGTQAIAPAGVIAQSHDAGIVTQNLSQNLIKNTTKPTTNNLPQATFRAIQRDIQKRFRVAPNTLQVNGFRRETWDGCLGLPLPNGACTAIAIPGWQVVVTNQAKNRFWVYNTDQNGTKIAYNATASLPRNGKISAPKIITQDKIIPTSSKDVIFQAAQTTGFSADYFAWELTRDGVLTRRSLRANPGKTETVRKLNKQELQRFINLLDNNSFSHFNRLSYLNMGAIAADAVSFQLNYNGAVLEYTQSNIQQYPTKLTRIISAWERLLQSSNP